jgi:aryl-alcohol dehydrogenase-like predicted oxidoreductase
LASGVGALRHRGARDQDAAIAAEAIWPILSAIALERRHSPAKVALAWVLSHSRINSVLVSVSSLAQLHELLAASRLPLTDADLDRLGRTSVMRASYAHPDYHL